MPDEAAAAPRTLTIGILVFEGFEPIDVLGFAEAFSIARFLNRGYGDGPPYPFETVLIACQLAKVKSINGPSVMPDWDVSQAVHAGKYVTSAGSRPAPISASIWCRGWRAGRSRRSRSAPPNMTGTAIPRRRYSIRSRRSPGQRTSRSRSPADRSCRLTSRLQKPRSAAF